MTKVMPITLRKDDGTYQIVGWTSYNSAQVRAALDAGFHLEARDLANGQVQVTLYDPELDAIAMTVVAPSDVSTVADLMFEMAHANI